MFLWRSLRPDAVGILLRYLMRRAASGDAPSLLAGRRPSQHPATTGDPGTVGDRPSAT